MSDWTAADLDRIGSATELEITTRRADGSLRPYVPIWVVRVGDELFVRSWEDIDRAYRDKYGRYGDTYVGPMTGPGARAATARLMAR